MTYNVPQQNLQEKGSRYQRYFFVMFICGQKVSKVAQNIFDFSHKSYQISKQTGSKLKNCNSIINIHQYFKGFINLYLNLASI